MKNPQSYTHLIEAATSIKESVPSISPICLQMVAVWATSKKGEKRFKKALKKQYQEQLVVIHSFQEYKKYYRQAIPETVDNTKNTSPKYRLLVQPTKWAEWQQNEDLSIEVSTEQAVTSFVLDNCLSIAYVADERWRVNKKGKVKDIKQTCLC